MRLLAIVAFSLMCVSLPEKTWEGVVLVDPHGVHHMREGDKPSGWSYPTRGYVLGVPLRYSRLSKQALEDIPGIGSSLATKLMNVRKKNPKATWDDIDSISGIGEKKLKLLQKTISLSD